MKDPSRIYRWILLVASVLTFVYLVGAALHENYWAQWGAVQRQYREILRQKATDERTRAVFQVPHRAEAGQPGGAGYGGSLRHLP